MRWVAKIAYLLRVKGCFSPEIGLQVKFFSISICLCISSYDRFYDAMAKKIFACLKVFCIFAYSY